MQKANIVRYFLFVLIYLCVNGKIMAQSYFVQNLLDDTILAAKNEDQKIHPASLTKIMTLLLTVEAIEEKKIDLYEVHTVHLNGINQKMTIKDLIILTSLTSDNEASNILGSIIAGNLDDFIASMNDKAIAIGLVNTRFSTSNGLTNFDQYSTNRELTILMKHFIDKFPQHESILNIKYAFVNGKFLQMKNEVAFNYKCIKSHKTGYTNASQYNIIAHLACGDEYNIIAVLTGAPSKEARNTLLSEMLNYSTAKIASNNGKKNTDFYLQKDEKIDTIYTIAPLLFQFLLVESIAKNLRTYSLIDIIKKDLLDVQIEQYIQNDLVTFNLPKPKRY